MSQHYFKGLAMKQYRIIALIFVALSLSAWRPSAPQPTERMIIMGQSADQVAGIVQNAQGTIERRLQIINGVVARVDRQQIAYLRSQGLKVTANYSLHGSATAESQRVLLRRNLPIHRAGP